MAVSCLYNTIGRSTFYDDINNLVDIGETTRGVIASNHSAWCNPAVETTMSSNTKKTSCKDTNRIGAPSVETALKTRTAARTEEVEIILYMIDLMGKFKSEVLKSRGKYLSPGKDNDLDEQTDSRQPVPEVR